METFGEVLKTARYESLMTLKEASAKLNVKLTTLQAYESGQLANPSYEFISRAQEVYGVSFKKLMGWRDKRDEEEYAYLARSMDSEVEFERVAKIIDFMRKMAREKK